MKLALPKPELRSNSKRNKCNYIKHVFPGPKKRKGGSVYETAISFQEPKLPCSLPGSQLWSVFNYETVCRDYLIHNDIIQIPDACPICGATQAWIQPEKTTEQDTGSAYYFICQKQGCNRGRRWQRSVLAGSFFGKCNVTKCQIMQFLYMWLAGEPRDRIIETLGWTVATFRSFATFARALVSAKLVGGKQIPSRKQLEMHPQDALYEAIWREENKNRLWFAMLEALRDVRVQCKDI